MIVPIRCAASVVIAASICLPAGPARAQPPAPAAQITCVNPASGTAWQVEIDYARAAVDGNPASIDADEIHWQDRKDLRNYTLDRKTGKLTVIAASSMGGNIWLNRCKLP